MVALVSSFVGQLPCRRHSTPSRTSSFLAPGSNFSSAGRPRSHARRLRSRTNAFPVVSQLKALVFDCDGVIVESEGLHREAYNAAFQEFNISCDGGSSTVIWDVEFYDVLQNQVGGGKPKMRWYFNKHGWPVSSVVDKSPETEEEQEKLIDTLQDWKSQKYRDLIGSGEVSPRPGVLRLMEEAKSKGLKVAVCSAATKGSVIFTLNNLLGKDRFESLDCFLAGDDVKEKKPSPLIYQVATQKLGVKPEECVVVEDSAIGLAAAVGAGMRCIITCTGSTKSQDFEGAERVVDDLDGPPMVSIDEFL
ncbi:hypothetical protein BSKO_08225 [Bryopsis sp. KO-2023]|nr:hypothetical protein BSKO_08225 [Bryopsis sp. KO-2023]